MSKSGKLCPEKKSGKIIKIVATIFGVVLSLAIAYVVYVVAYYHRIPDNQILEIVPAKILSADADKASESEESQFVDYSMVSVDREYTIVSYNVGFGAYSPSFTFFMDGGKKSWAESKKSATNLITGAANLALSFEPDFVLYQEIDVDSTRTYHLNELDIFAQLMPEYNYTFAVNYDSAFLLYPFYEPHGASNAGIATFSKYDISSSLRRSLPVSSDFNKLLDLDRCYSINRIPVENGKELVIINIHMSAYGGTEAVRTGQTAMLREEMAREYAAGNYVIVGGDYNHNLKIYADADNSGWAHAYDRAMIPDGFMFAIDLIPEEERNALHNTCRDAGIPYSVACPTVTLDGFIISENIQCVEYINSDNGYAYSDHDPVVMKFILN